MKPSNWIQGWKNLLAVPQTEPAEQAERIATMQLHIVLPAKAGVVAEATGWVWFYAICAALALPSFVLLVWLQQRGHFKALEKKATQ